MSKTIKVSKEHGVNPTIPICFWCGEETNEIVLLGKLKDDAEAPKNLVINYEPCDKCQELINDGVQLIGVTDIPSNPDMPPITITAEGVRLYPTQTFVVVKERFIYDFLSEESKEFIDSVIEKKALLLQEEVLQQILQQIKVDDESVQDIEEIEPQDIQDK